MSRLTALLTATAHRPYLLPAGPWRYYQEWNEALFLHWRVPATPDAAHYLARGQVLAWGSGGPEGLYRRSCTFTRRR
jgi:hypothetical protein